jgi:PAS domain S-box-containing protein
MMMQWNSPRTLLDPRLSLRARIAFVIAGLTLTLSVVLTLIAGQISGQQLDYNIGRSLAQLSSNVLTQSNQTIFERWREIRLTASRNRLFTASDSLDNVRAQLSQLVDTNHDYAWIGWVDLTGQVLASAGNRLAVPNVSSLHWFQQVRENPNLGAPYIEDVRSEALLVGTFPGTVPAPASVGYISIAMPVFSTEGSLVGILAAYVDARFLREQAITAERQVARQNGSGLPNPFDPGKIDVFITRANGTILVGPPNFNGLDEPPTPIPQASGQVLQIPGVQSALASNNTMAYVIDTWPGTTTSYLIGFAKDSGYRNFTGLGWMVLIRQRADLALASVAQLRTLLLALGVFFALLFSGVGWLLALQMTRPLQRVAQLARQIKIDGHRPPHPTPIRADEVTVLSETLDHLLVSLNARNTQLTTLNSKLEELVTQRTSALEASQRFNEKIVGTVPDMLYIYDFHSGTNIYTSASEESLLGYPPARLAEIFNHRHPTIMNPEDVAAYLNMQERLINQREGSLVECTFQMQHESGRWMWVLCRETLFSTDSAGNAQQVFGVLQDITLRKQAEFELLQTAATQERQRLARELHDSVTQTLFSASMVAETLPLLWDRGETVVKKNLLELSRLTRGALAEMRTLLNELRPSAISSADLEELLGQLLDAAKGRTTAELTLDYQSTVKIPTDIQIAVYRIVQEALNNVAKHARAKHVRVHLRYDETALTLVITDDGRGFDQGQTPTDHFGLGIMRERAAEIDAALTVQSEPGKGTEITLFRKSAAPMLELSQA